MMQWLESVFGGFTSKGPWPESLRLLEFSRTGWLWKKVDSWTLSAAFLSVIFLGAPGAGKSSALKFWIAALLRIRAGCLLLVYKHEAAEEFIEAAKAEGRSRDLIHVRPSASSSEDPKYRTNILTYELKRCGENGAVPEILNVLERVAKTLSGRTNQTSDEWRSMALRLLRYALHLQVAAYGLVDLLSLYTLINDFPASRSEIDEGTYRPALLDALQKANSRSKSTHAHALRLVEDYLIEWSEMSPKTRSSIVTTLKTFMDPMLSADLYYLLFSPKPNFWPGDVLQGKLIVLDYPAESSHTARMAAHLLKETLYRTIRTRKEPPSQRRPIGVICDELQAFMSEEDREVSNVSRGYRLVFLGATQNTPSLVAALGSAESAKSETDAFLANLQTKVITLTVDPTTATYLSDLLGKVRKRINNGGSGTTFAADGTVSFNSNHGFSETLEYRVEPAQWQTLRAGGRENNLWVDAVVMGSFLGGKTFTNGRRYLKVRFDQSKRLRRGSVRVVAPRIHA